MKYYIIFENLIDANIHIHDLEIKQIDFGRSKYIFEIFMRLYEPELKRILYILNETKYDKLIKRLTELKIENIKGASVKEITRVLDLII